jgi:mannitol-1-phosphate 5-dehydrogenase
MKEQMLMKQAIMFGAGNVGRGFLGQLFSESGYRVTFVDIDEPLLAALNERGHYTIQLVTNTSTQTVAVGPVRGLLATDQEQVVQALAEADIGATAVGARALEYIAPNLAAGIMRRANQGLERPLHLIVCENLKGAAQILRQMVEDRLPAAYHPYLAGQVGFVDTVIARMVPPLTPELRAQDPSLIIVEPYKELPVDADAFIGPPPEIVGMIPDRPFSFYTERKLYIHNAGHAVLAYLGYRQNYEYGYQALEHQEIAEAVRGAMTESQQALEKKYNLPAGRLTGHVNDLLDRFRNRALGDTIFRLGRDPSRKLAHQDRLVGAALNALSQQVQPHYLVEGIVAALHFDHPDDPVAGQLQQQLQQVGLETILKEICGLEPGSELARLIQTRFER